MARARRAPFFQANLGVFGSGRLTHERPRMSWRVSTDDQHFPQQRVDAGFKATFSQWPLSPIQRSIPAAGERAIYGSYTDLPRDRRGNRLSKKIMRKQECAIECCNCR